MDEQQSTKDEVSLTGQLSSVGVPSTLTMAQTWPISESASKRCFPKYISAKSTPADQMSIALVYFPEENSSSGARYALLGEQGNVSVNTER